MGGREGWGKRQKTVLEQQLKNVNKRKECANMILKTFAISN